MLLYNWFKIASQNIFAFFLNALVFSMYRMKKLKTYNYENKKSIIYLTDRSGNVIHHRSFSTIQ